MNDTILDQCKFLSLCQTSSQTTRQIPTSLKSYSDTLLFYYLGHLAISQTSCDILEIGLGGSTSPLIELASNHDKTFYAVDCDQARIDFVFHSKFQLPDNLKLVEHCVDSALLKFSNAIPTKLSYVHIDGAKQYNITKSDLDFSLDNIEDMGIICQDDYGNNKWPTVTNAVHALLEEGKVEILFVGDSSIWLTKKESHKKWIDILNQDFEFSLLKEFLNIRDSQECLNFSPSYFFMNGLVNPTPKENLPDIKYKYYSTLFKYASTEYLQMPYGPQSTPGINVFINSNKS